MTTPIRSTGVGQTKENILMAFPVPRSGMVQSYGEASVPKDGLWIGRNVHDFYGECRQRASWNLARDATLAAPSESASNHLTSIYTAQRVTTRDRFLLVGSRDRVQILQDAASGLGGAAGWVQVFAWGALRARVFVTRMTSISIGTPLHTFVVFCNGIDTPVSFDLTPATANFAAGTALTCANNWKDVCTTSDRIIGITETDVSWGEILRLDIWPLLNYKSLAETPDLCVAIRPVGTLHVAIWKEKSIWLGQARGGSSASYFTWKMLKMCDGPVSTASVVQDGIGSFWWLTRRGRVAHMGVDFQISYPCDGIWPFVRDDISQVEAEYRLSHGVYNPVLDEVHFFYVAAGQNASTFKVNKGIIVMSASTPTPYMALQADRPAFITDFLGTGTVLPDITASALVSETAYTNRAAGGSPTKVYLDEPVVAYQIPSEATAKHIVLAQELQSTGTDVFTAEIRTGIQPAPGGDTHRVEAIEPFLRRAVGSMPGTHFITVAPVTTNILDVQGGTLGTAVEIPGVEDVSQPTKATVGVTATGRFLGMQLLGANINSVIRFMGAVIHGRRQT